MILNLIILILCGSLIGIERQKASKLIGVRSIILLMLGAFTFTYISTRIGGDPSRVVAQIVSGVGFLGTGLIWKDKSTHIANLTTAILIWVTAALGSMICLGFLWESALITLLVYLVLKLSMLKRTKGE